MKIGQEIRTQTEPNYTRTNVVESNTFQQSLRSQTQSLKQQELQQLMKHITLQGNKLARFRSFRDLAKFKRMVKSFLQETVSSGLDLEHTHSFSLDGQNRKLAIVKQVDEKLVELTEEIMNREKKTVDILGLIGEIKGLLINIYT
ncbi:YaaR family protein [Oceanobacillus manasiensis]|uniref:YaaR family protein n=1 Tax=Oceanobacillus manasiensis TaxID=586413 RepID=UPI0005A93C5A|nr:YaaR family protein [Oceanobacillus manasiensis]